MNRGSGPLLLVLGAALLVGLFVWLKPPEPAVPPAAAVAVDPPAIETLEVATYTDDSGAQRIEWTIRNGQRIAGPELVSIKAGTLLILRATSDMRDELHLHGYDLQAELNPGEAGTLTFSAEHSGRYELELHSNHQVLAVLEVQPR